MRTRCFYCNTLIDSDARGIYQYVSGWERKRAQGGTNALRAATRRERWACHACIEKLVKIGLGQEALFEP